MNPPRLAVIADLEEEGWPSMDLAAEMLVHFLRREHAPEVEVEQLRPRMRRRLSRPNSAAWAAFTVDRLLNRFRDYPRYLRRRRAEFDLFHLVDHSYSQLVHELPAGRTVVTCHDLDTFGVLQQPGRGLASGAYRAMARRILGGMQKAARVVCVSHATRDTLLRAGWVPADRIRVVPNGVHPSCSPHAEPEADARLERLLGPARADAPELVHVGSTIPRKRIDVLLQTFASVRTLVPEARLVRVGGALTDAQRQLAERLGIGNALIELPFLDRPLLAALYRRGALLLQPSDAEGFGLPVAEAMACGTPAVASDLPVLREVAGAPGVFCAVGEVAVWSAAVVGLLEERRTRPREWEARQSAVLTSAGRYSWSEHARGMLDVYQEILGS